MRQIMGHDLFVSADFSALRKSPEEPNNRGKDRECESESMQWQQPAQVARTRTAANGSKVLLMQRVQSHVNIVDTTQYISRLRCTSNMVSKDSNKKNHQSTSRLENFGNWYYKGKWAREAVSSCRNVHLEISYPASSCHRRLSLLLCLCQRHQRHQHCLPCHLWRHLCHLSSWACHCPHNRHATRNHHLSLDSVWTLDHGPTILDPTPFHPHSHQPKMSNYLEPPSTHE